MTDSEEASKKSPPRELDTLPPMLLPPDLQSISGSNSPPAEDERAENERAENERAENEHAEDRHAEDRHAEGKRDLKRKHARPPSENSNLAGISISGFQIVRELGRGGMGAVFLARDESLNRQVALKIVSQSMLGSTGLRDRFDSEVQTLAGLQHSNIAQLYSAGLQNDEPYFAMEYVDGPTLDEFAAEPLGNTVAAQLMTKLCDAVEYCHDQGVIHRDLKPSNILMTSGGQPKIADFGLAKALHTDDSSTRTGEILGTPGYMSPEQAGGVVKQIGPSCDVYGLGAILYRLLTGRAPFVSQEPFQTVIQVLSEEPISPRHLNRSVSRDLETICLKCLEKKSAKRYASASELRDDLNRLLEGKPIQARPNSWLQVSGKWMRRNPASTIATLALLTVIIGSLIGLVMHNSVLSKELARSSRLANSGSEFAKWITEDHLADLVKIGGTTEPRSQLIQQVSDFLQESYNDMPADPIYTERLGVTYSQLAATQGAGGVNTKGDLEQARNNLNRAIELYDRTLQDVSDERLLRLKVDALISLSDLEGRLGREKLQQQFFDQARLLANQLKEASAESTFCKIQVLNREIEQQIDRREFQTALDSSKQLATAIDQLQSYNSEEYEIELVNQQIIIRNYRATCFKNLDDYAAAENSYREMVRLAEESSQSDPDNVLKQQRLASALVNLGDILFEQTKADVSIEFFERATVLARKLADEDLASVDAQLNLGVKLSRVATNHQYLGNLELAENAIREAIERLESLKQQGKKDIAIEEGIIIYLQTYASLGFLQEQIDKAKERFDLHRRYCEEYMQKHEDNSFAVNQLAENSLTQALMIFGTWMSSPVDPATIRQADEYKQIKSHLETGLEYYNVFEQKKPLDIDQQQQRKRIQEIEKLLEQTVQQLEGTAEPQNPDQ